MTRESAKDIPALRLSRREVLAAGAAAAATDVLTIGAGAPTMGNAEAVLLSLLRHRENAREVGHAVLTLERTIGGRDQLLSDLFGALGLDPGSISISDMGDLGERLAHLIQDDFAARRTLKLDGWLVSLTECRLCALAALG